MTLLILGKDTTKTNWRKSTGLFSDMEEYISDFFDEVLVNAKDCVIKQNRLNMLTRLVSSFSKVVP